MNLSENLKLLRTRRVLSQQDLADVFGIKRTSLSGYENGTTYPPLELLIKLSDFFKISTDKLLKMNLSTLGEKRLSDLERGADIDLEGKQLRILATTVDDHNEENIEMVPIKAKAGYTDGFADPDFIKVLPTFQLPFLSKSKKYRSFQIKGDSMPPVSEGSWVTGEYLQNWINIQNGHPYIVITKDEGAVFKVIQNKIKQRGALLLISANPEYLPYEVRIEDVLEIWKFVHYISSDLPEPNLSRDQLAASVINLQNEMTEIKNLLQN
ncbi:MAG: transcriptional regulator with XRE-family HTH domain [Sphingobacteriales bacterium]|jgi:transcriptional regulator with XRE-family HTH domain